MQSFNPVLVYYYYYSLLRQEMQQTNTMNTDNTDS